MIGFVIILPISIIMDQQSLCLGNSTVPGYLSNTDSIDRTGLKITFKFFTEVLFLSIILCLANTGIVNVLVSTLYSKPDEVTGYECGLYSTKGGRLKDRISFYTVGLTMMIFDVEVVLTFAFLLSLTFATT